MKKTLEIRLCEKGNCYKADYVYGNVNVPGRSFAIDP